MLRRIAAVISLALLALPSAAQSAPPIAFVQGGEVYVQGPGGVAQITNTEQEYKYIPSMAWSPDGTRLAFLQNIESVGADGFPSYSTDLFLVDPAAFIVGQPPQPLTSLAQQIAAGFPPAWDAEGNLYYVQDNPANMNAQSPSDYLVDIFRLVGGAGSPELFATVPFGVGCGGGTSEPHYMRYNQEAGFGGNPVIFIPSAYGIIMSLNCSGVGVGLLADGVLSPLDETLARAVLSPDGRTLAAIKVEYVNFPPTTSLYTVDLESRTVTLISTATMPDQLAWGLDGALYYSASAVVGDLFSAEEATLIGQAQGYDTSLMTPAPIPAMQASVNRINLSTNEEVQVAAHDASFIGRMRALPGGLAYSVIGSIEAWGRGLIDGTIDPMSEAYFNNWQSLVSLEVYSLDGTSLGSLEQMEVAPAR